ncbi:MAG: hypothetical protein HYS81_04460 [Candidatus Aenigmatarchaeota archaeon]|nr:MAG: hypothetical protein HYS81_04460 [Candidatus Aenigmarchaeota archaeon]
MPKMGYKFKEPSDLQKAGLAAALVLVLIVAGYEYTIIQTRDGSIASLEGTLAATQQVLDTTEAALQTAHTDNDALRSDINARDETIRGLGNDLGLAENQIADLTPITKRFSVVGVRGDGTGVIIPLEVKIVSGDGSVSVNIKNVDLQSGTQASVRTAVDVAEDYTGDNFNKKDVTVSFINEESAIVTIDGPSAGGAITATIIAAAENETMRDDVLMTGTIEENGSIGPVGGVFEKAEAAKDEGAEIFIVPSGQSVSVGGIQIIEVNDINRVVKLLFE